MIKIYKLKEFQYIPEVVAENILKLIWWIFYVQFIYSVENFCLGLFWFFWLSILNFFSLSKKFLSLMLPQLIFNNYKAYKYTWNYAKRKFSIFLWFNIHFVSDLQYYLTLFYLFIIKEFELWDIQFCTHYWLYWKNELFINKPLWNISP